MTDRSELNMNGDGTFTIVQNPTGHPPFTYKEEPKEDEVRMSVMTFNLRFPSIKHDTNHLWPDRRELVAKVITRNPPTLIGTQEGLIEMLNDMEAQLPQYAWVGNGRLGEHEDEHTAIFYHKDALNLLDWGQFWLAEYTEGPKMKDWGASHHRICTWAHLQSREHPHKQFLAYNTHLDHSSPLARQKGIRLIWGRLSAHAARLQLPFLLMGDMNSEPDHPVIQFLRGQSELDGMRCQLTDGYTVLKGQPGKTIHGFKGGTEGQPIDYIFVSSDIQLVNTRVIRDMFGERYPSDHYPVIANMFL